MSETELLYKYVPINNDTLTMISPNTFKFTLVSELNDIYDCKVLPDYQKYSDDLLFKKWLEFNNLKQKVFSEEQRKKIISDERKRLASPEHKNEVENFMNDSHGVLSLSRTRESILMWGHYSDSFKGMCIGYDKFRLIQEFKHLEEKVSGYIDPVLVKYVEEPQIIVPDPDDLYFMDDVYEMKFKDWEYEKEVRLVYYKIKEDFPNTIVPLIENFIESISFGPKTDNKFIDLIMKKTSGLKIEFYRAKKVSSSYKLEFERIN